MTPAEMAEAVELARDTLKYTKPWPSAVARRKLAAALIAATEENERLRAAFADAREIIGSGMRGERAAAWCDHWDSMMDKEKA